MADSSVSYKCPNCGAPVPQNVEGFENTMEFQKMNQL